MTLFSKEPNDLFSIKDARTWASQYLRRKITVSNISYLIQYGKIRKYSNNGKTLVSKRDLKRYYDSYNGKREIEWKDRLGHDLNWHLSFDNLREKDTTKHVHRLHPYKGKFIPQLVEYFLDKHTDDFKKKIFLKKNDIVLDPFCGSGTTLVQANELNLHAIGIDVSSFNSFISNVKVTKVPLGELAQTSHDITMALKKFITDSSAVAFEKDLLEELAVFNKDYFPSPDFKFKVNKRLVNEEEYGKKKEKVFAPIYRKLQRRYKLRMKQYSSETFLDKWYMYSVRQEIDFLLDQINKIENKALVKILSIILSRTIRSCRATTHSDLATLKRPVLKTYYCTKHKKICKPLFSVYKWWSKYSYDTIHRLSQFERFRTDTTQICLTGDSRNIDIIKEIDKVNKQFAQLTKKQKIRGIFTSPPYVGLIDYHEQHAYAYELFNIKRRDELEIGPLFKGRGQEARKMYVQGVADVFINCKKYLIDDYDIFVVANDKFRLYPIIAEKAGMKIVNKFKRPVLNRTERDKAAYSEIIFHFKRGE